MGNYFLLLIFNISLILTRSSDCAISITLLLSLPLYLSLVLSIVYLFHKQSGERRECRVCFDCN